jgi:adenine deaminase
MVLVPDLTEFKPKAVICNGEVIFEDGHLVKTPRRHAFSAASLNTVKLPRRLAPSDFIIRSQAGAPSARVRVIEMVTDLVTAERQLDLPLSNGELIADPDGGLCKIAAVDRTHSPGRLFNGLIKGFGLTRGAVACSAAWDTSDIVTVGAHGEDMAYAVNRLADLQGGAVLCDGGHILSEIPMPIFGLACDLPMATLAARLEAMKQAMSKLGVTFPDPLLSLITLTGAAIPYLRICEEGLVNLKDGKTLGLFVS